MTPIKMSIDRSRGECMHSIKTYLQLVQPLATTQMMIMDSGRSGSSFHTYLYIIVFKWQQVAAA